VNAPADPGPDGRPNARTNARPNARRSIDVDRDYLMNRLHQRGHTMRYRWDPGYPMSPWRGGPSVDTNLRVSDAERNAVADKLSRHFAEGRLDETEFKERLDAAMSAKTQGDLSGLFDDLPRFQTEPPPPPSRRRRLVPFLLIIAFLAVAASASLPFGPRHWFFVPWPLVVIAGLFIWARFGHHRYQHRHHQALEH
jgi:hypothetical protein